MKIIKLITAAFLLFLFPISCIDTKGPNIVKISALSDDDYDHKGKNKYILIPSSKYIKEGDLQFREYKRMITRSLKNAGYIPVASKNEADILIYMQYGISGPKEEYEQHSVPTYGQMGMTSAYTVPSPTIPGAATTFYNPNYGVVGYSNRVERRINYTKILSLTALENKKGKEDDELWKVTAESTGDDNNMRKIFPSLVIAIEPYLGKNSHQEINITVPDDDERIAKIRE